MDILIKGATILSKLSDHHLQKRDVLVSDGIIKAIGDNIKVENVDLIEGNELYCSIGLCDIGTHTGDPGFEHRETIQSLTAAALAGGFTALAVFPNTKPITQTKASISYLKDHPHKNGVEIFPIGALSKDTKGQDIGEYMDMKYAGIVAVSDGIVSIQDAGLLSRALQYSNTLCLPVMHQPNDAHLSNGGEMHEGIMSTSMGMKGIPEIAELNMVQRDILLQQYNEGILIEHAISASESVSAIKQAKANGQKLYSTVAYMNLLHTDEDLVDFDSNLKVSPVLRAEDDRKSLIAGLIDGSIDAIISNHTPLDEEVKNLEFPYATPGAIGLETCLPATIGALKTHLPIEEIIYKMAERPREILGIHIPVINEGEKANLCIFDLKCPWIYEAEQVKSLSKNSPYLGATFDVKVLKTLV